MISAFLNIRKIPELRNRVLFSLVMVVLYRIGCALTVPGVNASVLRQYFQDQVNNSSSGGVAQLFNIFSGGALEQCAIFSLGVMPYISASIMMQLLTAVVPQLGKLAKEDGGRQKISQYTRYVTIVLAFSRDGCWPNLSRALVRCFRTLSRRCLCTDRWFPFPDLVSLP